MSNSPTPPGLTAADAELARIRERNARAMRPGHQPLQADRDVAALLAAHDACAAERDRLAGRLAEVARERDRWYGKAPARVVERNQAEAKAETLRQALAALVERVSDAAPHLRDSAELAEAGDALAATAPAGPGPARLDVTA